MIDPVSTLRHEVGFGGPALRLQVVHLAFLNVAVGVVASGDEDVLKL